MMMQHMDAAQMDHATGIARQVCARVFRDGGTPADAMEVFGIAHVDVHAGWRDAVDTIARALAATPRSAPMEPPFKAAA
jgi:hypothetical protein